MRDLADVSSIDWGAMPNGDHPDIGQLLTALAADSVESKADIVFQLELSLTEMTGLQLFQSAAHAIPFLVHIAITSSNRGAQLGALEVLNSIVTCLSYSLQTLTAGHTDNVAHIALQAEKTAIESFAATVDTSDDNLRQEFRDLLEYWVEPPSPCPHCGKSLATPRAQQCLHCHAKWHAKAT